MPCRKVEFDTDGVAPDSSCLWPISPQRQDAPDSTELAAVLSPPSLPGSLGALERFEVIQLLGAGGSGMVLLALDTEAQAPSISADSGALVALKVLRPQWARKHQLVKWFLAEAHNMQQLRHPHIIPLLETSVWGEVPYFVMPYVRQGSLSDRLRSGRPVEPELAVRLARQLAGALRYAHARGVIHRDVKPANILLGQHGVFLADFGLSQTWATAQGCCVGPRFRGGTAPYLSPGLANGAIEYAQGDIYAFGAALYEMLTGQPPYDGDSAECIVEQILKGPPRPVRDVNPAIPPRLAAIVEKAMARHLRDRYAEMADLVADLDAASAAGGNTPLTA